MRMKPLRNVSLLAALAGLSLVSAAHAQPANERCERSCLYGLMDTYLRALVAHDPKQAPLTEHVKFTENTNRLMPGDGLWQTITGLGTYTLYAADPQLGNVVYYGTAQENGQRVLLAVRLHQQAGHISEVESFVIRKPTGIHGNFENLKTVDPVWAQPLGTAERLPRAALIHAANQYFNGIEQSNGDIVPFDDDCIRIENGVQTAPSTGSATGALAGHPPLTAREQFNSKAFRYITQVTQRRFPVVDEEDGIVFATVMFQHPGNVPTGDWAKTGLPANPNGLSAYPNTTQIIEAFKIRHGRLLRIFAYVSLLPYRQSPGW